MDNLINNPNPWILNICGGVIAALISSWVIQRLAQRRAEKLNKFQASEQIGYQATIKESLKENGGASKVWETIGSCLGIAALTIGFTALAAFLRWIETNYGETVIALFCCVPTLLFMIVAFIITAREEGLI